MNPLVTKYVAAKLIGDKRTPGNQKIITNVVKITAAIGLLYGASIIVKKILKNSTDTDSALDVQFAKRLQVAMFPSNQTWFPDGTNENEIFKIGYEIANNRIEFKEVQNSYKKLYNHNLNDRLQSELNSSDYAKFLKLVSPTYIADEDKDNPVYFNEGKIIYVTEKTAIFKNVGDYFSVATLPAYSYLSNALTTGNQRDYVDAVTGGLIFKQKRVEVKHASSNLVRWLDAEFVKTMPNTKENLNTVKAKYKGYQIV